ncbi:restriction endonuclease subunit S, partial [Rhizobium hidalgonense]
IALHEKKLAQTQNLKKAMLEKMFPKVGSTQPEIRLRGFSGNWDTIKLGGLCSIGDIDHRMPESAKNGIPYLMTGDFLGINGLDFENAKLISNEDYEQLSKKIKPEIGEILYALYASVGTVRLVVTDIKFLISYSCAILKTSVNSNGEYLFYWFQTGFAQNQIE